MKRTSLMTLHLMQFAAVAFIVMSLPSLLWAGGTKPTKGGGTSTSPYEIATMANLVWFRDAVNGVNTGTGTGTDICGKLTANIALSGTWTPIGNKDKKYTGTFDGNGKTISGFSIPTYTTTYQGLFGYISGATLRNFTLTGTMTSTKALTGSDDATGTVVGRAAGASVIEDIASSVNLTITGVAQKHLGGIVGAMESTTKVLRCTYTGTMNVGNTTDCVGGIVGFAYASCSGTIQDCLCSGTITSVGSGPTLGGILGYTNDESSNFGGVQNCLGRVTFNYTGSATYVNGVVGRIRNRASTTKNNFFLPVNGIPTKACNTDGPSIPATNVATTLDECKGGKLTWMLNGSANGTTWRQTLGTDTYPTLATNALRIYQVDRLYCNGTVCDQVFLNTPTSSDIQHNMDQTYTYKAPTCTADGRNACSHCSYCRKYFDKNLNEVEYRIPCGGHAYDADTSYCTRCKHGFFRYKAVNIGYSGLADVNCQGFDFGDGVVFVSEKRDKVNDYQIVEMKGKITKIPLCTFQNTCLNYIWLPSTLTSIEYFAFRGCIVLRTPKLPDSIKEIGKMAFADCTSMRGTFTMPASLAKMDEYAFENCNKITKVVFPATTKDCAMGSRPFLDCTMLDTIVHYSPEPPIYWWACPHPSMTVQVPSGSVSAYRDNDIGWEYNKNTVECISHPSFKLIKEQASTCFEKGVRSHYECPNCRAMSSTEQGSDVLTLEDLYIPTHHTFSPTDPTECLKCNHCFMYYNTRLGGKLQTMILPNVVDQHYEDGRYVVEMSEPLDTFPSSLSNELKEIILPYTVKHLVPGAFDRMNRMESCILPRGLETMGERAFSGCYSLRAITLPETLREIPANAFFGCGGMSSVNIPSSITAIGDGAFYECKSINVPLVIPSTVKSIGNEAFRYCESIPGTLEIPGSVEQIGDNAFGACRKIEKLVLNEGVQTIGESAFMDCVGLSGTVVLPNSLKMVSNNLFAEDYSIHDVHFGSGIESIGSLAFLSCRGLVAISELPQGLRRIEDGAFKDCVYLNMKTLVIPDSVTYIGSNAFGDVDSDTIMVGRGVKSIGAGAFYGIFTSYVEVDFDDSCVVAEDWFKSPINCMLVCSEELTNIPASTFAENGVLLKLKRGDVDRNGTVSVADICRLLQMQSDGTLTTHDLKTADTDRDDIFTPQDVQGIVDKVLE